MSSAEWRALIAAYLENRLSADAFRRRFLEAFEAAATARRPVPPSVQDLYFVVEAYAGDAMGRGHAVSDDFDLQRAARAAAAALTAQDDARPSVSEPPSGGPRVVILTSDGASQEDARRAVWTIGTIGGLGCFAMAAYVALGFAQVFAVAAQVESVLSLGPAPSTLIALVIAFVPVIGGVVAFFGATDVWGWAWPLAAAAFLVLPALTALGGWRMLRRR